MELYLRWLEKYEKEPSEETPLGLILCAGKTSEQIELLQLKKSVNFVRPNPKLGAKLALIWKMSIFNEDCRSLMLSLSLTLNVER